MIRQGTKLTIYGETDVGQLREHNEDFIGWDAHLGLILLADGMGGHNAGEVASELASRGSVVGISNASRMCWGLI